MGHNSSIAAQTVELLWGLTSQLIQKIQERRGNINIVAYCILCYNKIALERESERETVHPITVQLISSWLPLCKVFLWFLSQTDA